MYRLGNFIAGIFEVIGFIFLMGWFVGAFGLAYVGMAFELNEIFGWIVLTMNTIVWIVLFIDNFFYSFGIFHSDKFGWYEENKRKR